MAVLVFLKLAGYLCLLMYGMKLTSEGLQKVAGNQMRQFLDRHTGNRFASLLTGALITGIVLSSTSTSVMAVSFVHAGMLSVAQGLSVIMGASVGNTFVAWIMAAEFSYELSNMVYLLLIIALWLSYSRNHRERGESLFGLCFIFLSLGMLCHLADEAGLTGNDGLAARLAIWGDNYGTYAVYLFAGALLTLMVRSSAALMAVAMILCSTGVLSIYSGTALVMGENIGRAILTGRAASDAGTNARRVAAAQCIFNLVGILWAFWTFPYFVDLLCRAFGQTPDHPVPVHNNMAYVLAAFHTCFSLCNAVLFIGLIHPLERLAGMLVPPQQQGEPEDGELQYISCGLLTTPELSVLEAQKEIINYAEMTCKMFTQTRYLLTTDNEADFNRTFARVERYEASSDAMEMEIANYLDEVSDDRLSAGTKNHIRSMLREVSEIESIGDSCYKISRTVKRKRQGKGEFTPRQLDHLHQMFLLAEQALEEMKRLLSAKRIPTEARTSFYIEQEINRFRTQLCDQNIIDVNKHAYSYQTGTMYMDIVNECEKLADYVINVVEALLNTVHKEE